MLCVSFSLKSKAINVFPKHILKSKAGDQSNHVRKKLFCHVMVKKYLSNVLLKILNKIESTWRREIKEQAPQLTLLYRSGTVRTALEPIFKKIADFQTCNFIQKRPKHRWFPVNIAKFLILFILKNICKRLLFNFFNGSLLFGPKGLRSRLYDGVRLQGLSDRSSFCF